MDMRQSYSIYPFLWRAAEFRQWCVNKWLIGYVTLSQKPVCVILWETASVLSRATMTVHAQPAFGSIPHRRLESQSPPFQISPCLLFVSLEISIRCCQIQMKFLHIYVSINLSAIHYVAIHAGPLAAPPLSQQNIKSNTLDNLYI